MAAMTAKPLARRSTAFGVSDVIIGTSPLGGIGTSISDAAAADIVEKCVAAGFRDFDTAPLYGLGKAEERLGEGLRRSGKAAQCRVWTKVGRLIRTAENVADPDDVEEANVPGRGIYVDSPKDARPVQDYSWNGAFLSYDDSVRRLGENIKICGLRCHDPETKLLESLAVCTGGSLEGLSALRQRHGTEVSIGLNDADVALRLLQAVQSGTQALKVDSVMLAGRWHLLDQTGAEVFRYCAEHSIEVHVAGVYASGLLAGGSLYEYRKPSMAEKKRLQSWAALCAEHSVSLKAADLAFAFLPACVSKVAVGLAEASLVSETVALLAEAKAVPVDLWRDAVAKGLLPEGLVEGL